VAFRDFFIMLSMNLKLFFALVIFCCSFLGLKSQNLVPNHSFEKCRNLPIKKLPVNYFDFERRSSNLAFKRHLNYWFSATQTSPDLRVLSDDYYHKYKSKYGVCDRAKTGQHAIGLITYMQNEQSTNYREYIEVKLKKKLRAKIKTNISFWILRERKSKLATNNIGCYFSKGKIQVPTFQPILVQPQVNVDTIIDRTNDEWIKIELDFIPDADYSFMTIGNFFLNEKTKMREVKNLVENPFRVANAYYLIDEVKVWQEGNVPPQDYAAAIKVKKYKEGIPIVFKNVQFSLNSAILEKGSTAEIDQLVSHLKENKQIKIAIHGHTDNIGEEEYNLVLSTKRAQSIYQYLKAKGVEKERLSYQGFGEKKPLQGNNTEEGKSVNRRVEFIITSQ